MADTINNSPELAIGITNSLDKIEYIKVPNPKRSGLTEQAIRTAMQPFITNQILIDNNNELILSDSQITTAYTEYDTIHHIDLT